MRVLLISKELIGSALVHRLIAEGQDVRVYIEDPTCAHCLDGFVEKVGDWRRGLDWVGREGLVLFDDVGWDGLQNELRSSGYRVVGGDAFSDRLELDREHFRTVLEDCGVSTLESHDFSSALDARNYILENPARWVLKHSSHMSTATFVGRRDDGKDVLELLRLYDVRGIRPIHLQRAVQGVEIGVARYFNGLDWIGPIEINIEHKALFPGDLGPLTAEMGTLAWYEDDESIPLFAETLGRLRSYLASIKYKGDIDINCIVNGDGIWPLEATTRFGSPATQVQCQLHLSPWHEFLGAIADGAPYDLEYRRGFALGVTIAMPPFPFGAEFMPEFMTHAQDRTRVFIDPELSPADLEKIHFEEAVMDDDCGQRTIFHRGRDGYAAFATGFGNAPRAAQADAYRVIDALHIPRMFYRNDIGDSFIQKDGAFLERLGVLKPTIQILS